MSSDPATLARLRIDRTAAPLTGKRTWLVFSLVLFLAALGGWWWAQRRITVIEVITVPVRERADRSMAAPRTLLNASGYVTARRSATVSSKVTGKVVEVNVEEGRRVEAGDVLAKLDASNVEASLRLAQAQLASSRAAVAETEPNLAFTQGELKRFRDLASGNVVSESDFRRTEADAKGMAARIARQTAEIGVAESEVDQWKQQLDDTIIRAPFGGIVTSKNAQPGEMISPMSVGGFTRTGICTIVDMTSLEIEVDVNESFINRIQSRQAVEATLDAYAEWKVPCKVIAIIPTADRQKATVKVRVGFDALDPRILPEMAVKVAFQSAEAPTGANARASFWIPKSSVQNLDRRDLVWVVGNGRAERRAVTVGEARGDEIEVTTGLRSGEKVVVDPPAGLADGAAVLEKGS